MNFNKYLMFSIFMLIGIIARADSQASYDLSGRWGLGLGLGTSSVASPSAFTKGASELDGGFVGSLWARYHCKSGWGGELSYSRLNFDFPQQGAAGLDPSTDLLAVSGAYRFWPEERMHLLLQAGLGLAKSSDFSTTDSSSSSKLALNARVGGEYMATPDVMLALHLDYLALSLDKDKAADSHLNVWAPMISLTYYFGGMASAPAPGDSDNDGISDLADKCPGTLPNTNVGGDGCPLKSVKGDADGDGVLDANDKCPGTLQGEKVTEFGCSKQDRIEITLNVQFESGSSKINPQFTGDLQKFGEFMMKYPETYAEIEGHTDNTGAEKLNYSISQKRADSVRSWILNRFKKIPKKRLTAKGYGPSQPVGDNSKPEGRLKNRRVVAHVQTEAAAK